MTNVNCAAPQEPGSSRHLGRGNSQFASSMKNFFLYIIIIIIITITLLLLLTLLIFLSEFCDAAQCDLENISSGSGS